MWKVERIPFGVEKYRIYDSSKEKYLWRDGKEYGQTYIKWESRNTEKAGRWNKKKEANEFLTNYLKGEMMSNQEKINQCKADIKALEENLAKLEAENKKPDITYVVNVAVGVRDSVSYPICVKAKGHYKTHDGIQDCCELSVNEAKTLIKNIQTMIDYVEEK